MTTPVSQPYRVIVAYDGSPLAERALESAIQTVRPHPHAEIHVLTVGVFEGVLVRSPVESEPMEEAAAADRLRLHVGEKVESILERTGPTHLDKVAVYLSVGHPSERTVALAEAVDADLIILGTHSRDGLTRFMLGSVAEAVVRRAPCGVLVIRPRDFYHGEKLPEVQGPPNPGEHSSPRGHYQPVYHYVSRVAQSSSSIMPAI